MRGINVTFVKTRRTMSMNTNSALRKCGSETADITRATAIHSRTELIYQKRIQFCIACDFITALCSAHDDAHRYASRVNLSKKN
jgi:hypothetical protein